jgi:hypothetical protein
MGYGIFWQLVDLDFDGLYRICSFIAIRTCFATNKLVEIVAKIIRWDEERCREQFLLKAAAQIGGDLIQPLEQRINILIDAALD